ncbi:MAG: hypothetical protein IT566_06035 [Rhodospirillaceae bacterium]|nr:hypothetical protein [Rhodospirillaceae bacterium]
MNSEHILKSRIKEREMSGPHLIRHEHVGLGGRIAVIITNAVGTMWCAYIFAAIALISLPAAIQGGAAAISSWITGTFLQVVLLSVIMLGQKVAAEASDKQALQTYKDAEALLKIQDEMRRLIEINNNLTGEIHRMMAKERAAVDDR